MLNEEIRHFLRYLQLIAEMVGLDTSEPPSEGANEVVEAVEAFVAKAGGGLTLDEASARVSEIWLDHVRRLYQPSPSAHDRGVKAYFAASGITIKRKLPSSVAAEEPQT